MRWIGVVPLLLLGPPAAMGQPAQEIEDLFWRSVECTSRLQVHAYLETYPTGRYLAEAGACLEGQLGLDRAARVLVQQGLAAVGHDPGPADGLFGGVQTRTRQAIRTWQADKGLAETGYLTREQAATLMAVGQEGVEAEQAAQAEQAAREEAARQAQEAARQAQADDAAYAAAARADTLEGYGEYLRAYPQGRHIAEARRRQRQRQWRAGQTFRDELQSGGQGPEMVIVPAGSFLMGSPPHEGLRDDDEGPGHRVTIAQPFAVGVYEVTQEVWGAVMGANPSEMQHCAHCPVEQVSWEDVQAFLRQLNGGSGRYRLPSEAEWEYAARGGTQSRGYQYAGSDTLDAVGWSAHNSGDTTHPVGQKQANELGLHDLSGNVWEWIQDCWNESYIGAPRDGRAWESGDCSRRVLRGGSWAEAPRNLRSANRSSSTASNRFVVIGFRLARSVE